MAKAKATVILAFRSLGPPEPLSFGGSGLFLCDSLVVLIGSRGFWIVVAGSGCAFRFWGGSGWL